MSIDYSFKSNTKNTVQQVLERLRNMPGVSPLEGEAQAEGVVISVFEATRPGTSVIQEAFDFSPTVTVYFTVDKEQIDQGVLSIVQISNELLALDPSDSLLLFNGELPLLVRRDGRLILDNTTNFWQPDHLALVKLPYLFQHLPML